MIKKIALALVFVLFGATSASAVTFYWDHNCDYTTHFNLYYSPNEAEGNQILVDTVTCPTTELEVSLARNGYYTVTAANETLESDFSISFGFFFNSLRREFENFFLLYEGMHQDYNADTSDTNWVITRYTHDLLGRVILTETRTTSWDDRATGWD